jgi:hypothetical protein
LGRTNIGVKRKSRQSALVQFVTLPRLGHDRHFGITVIPFCMVPNARSEGQYRF